MYCGICSEVCPTGAIRHSPEFEGSCYDPAAMVRHFVLDAPMPSYKPKKAEEDIKLMKKIDTGKEFMDLFAQP
jgi:formate hydrogenlyase subunit 6/NADH:ubiquinone oxidoreductase subunit I